MEADYGRANTIKHAALFQWIAEQRYRQGVTVKTERHTGQDQRSVDAVMCKKISLITFLCQSYNKNYPPLTIYLLPL